MKVPGRADQRAGVVNRELIRRRAGAVRGVGHVRERVLAVRAAAAVNVEHRIDVVRHHIHPDRMYGRDCAAAGALAGTKSIV